MKVYLERTVYCPGETVRGHVEVNWKRKRKVRGIHVRLVGDEETEIRVTRGSGKHRSTRTYREVHRVFGEEIRLWGGRRVGWLKAMGEGLSRPFKKLDYPELPAGRHRYPFKFRLPERALPSFSGSYAGVEYSVTAQVDVPLARDKTFRGVLHVVPRPSARLGATHLKKRPRTNWLTRAFKASLDLELKTKACPLTPDAPLEGTLTVRNRSEKRIRGAKILLSGVEVAHAHGHRREDTHTLEKGYLRAPDPSAERLSVNFGVKTPGHSYPYRGRYSRLDWWLTLELDIARGFDATIEVPLKVRRPRR